MNLKCEICAFEATHKKQMPGHKSGHVRRGELEKQDCKRDYTCSLCQKLYRNRKTFDKHSCKVITSIDDYALNTKRKRVLEEANYRCEICGFDERRRDGKHVVQIDHVDGNKQNNLRDNLRVLCPNCHAIHSEHFMFYGRKHYGDMKRFSHTILKDSSSAQISEVQASGSGKSDEVKS